MKHLPLLLRPVPCSWRQAQRRSPFLPLPPPLPLFRRFSSEPQGGFLSSFIGKIKGVFKSGDSAQDPPPPQPQPDVQSPIPPVYNLMTFADEMKSALKTSQRFESLSKLIQTRSSLMGTQMDTKVQNFEEILRALSKHDPTGEKLEQKHKAAVAAECGCSIQEVNDILEKYEWIKATHARLNQMNAKGEAVPKTLEDLKKLMINTSPRKYNPSQSAVKNEVSRNASCPCGSGKKFKRCCGRAT